MCVSFQFVLGVVDHHDYNNIHVAEAPNKNDRPRSPGQNSCQYYIDDQSLHDDHYICSLNLWYLEGKYTLLTQNVYQVKQYGVEKR